MTGYPIVHTQVISCWLLILYLLLHAQFLCLLFSYFLAINRGAHNHCCQRKGVWEINLALKALGKLKISLLVAETMHSLHPVRAVSSHLANYIKGISFKRFLRCNSTLGAQRRVSQRSDLCLLKLRINAYIWIYIYIYICSKQCENLSWLISLCVSSIYFCQRDPCYTRGIYSQEKAVCHISMCNFRVWTTLTSAERPHKQSLSGEVPNSSIPWPLFWNPNTSKQLCLMGHISPDVKISFQGDSVSGVRSPLMHGVWWWLKGVWSTSSSVTNWSRMKSFPICGKT